MVSKSGNNLNIKIDSSEEEKKNDNTASQYIIDMNKNLMEQNKRLLSQIFEKESTIEDLELDNGSSEKSNVYLKNVLINFNEISKIQETYRDNSNYMINELYTQYKNVKYDIKILVNYIYMFCVLNLFLLYIFCDPSIWIYFIVYNMSIFLFIEINLRNLKLFDFKKTKNSLIEMMKQIKEILENQDLIHEFIEQI